MGEFKVGDRVRVIPQLKTCGGRVIPAGAQGYIEYVGRLNRLVRCVVDGARAVLGFEDVESLTPAAGGEGDA